MKTERQALVFVPGMMCDGRLFDPQIAHLSDECDIWVADIGGKDSIESLAIELLAEAPFRRFSLCGLSMGGIVAMEVARQAPQRVERLALLDTNHLADAAERFEIRNRQIAAARHGDFERVVAEEMMPFYFAEQNRADPVLRTVVMEMARDLGADAFVNQSVALRDRKSAAETIADYPGPVLVLCGEEDALCPPARHEAIAELCQNAWLSILSGAGHLSTLERPQAVNLELSRWLATA